jgi:TetR/AcrR family transcriptional regulator
MPPLPAPSETKSAPQHARMTGEDRRRQLIEVAIDLFGRRGFAGTTTKEIAAAAGVTEAIIFRHFATKQDFYKAILDYKCGDLEASEWFTEMQKCMNADDDEGLFRFLASTLLRFYREEPQFERLLLYAALEGHELAIMHHNQTKLPVGGKLKEYIARRQAQGALRQCDPEFVLFSLIGLPHFYALQKYIHKCGDLPLSDDQVVDTFVTILMNGLRTKELNGNPQ